MLDEEVDFEMDQKALGSQLSTGSKWMRELLMFGNTISDVAPKGGKKNHTGGRAGLWRTMDWALCPREQSQGPNKGLFPTLVEKLADISLFQSVCGPVDPICLPIFPFFR